MSDMTRISHNTELSFASDDTAILDDGVTFELTYQELADILVVCPEEFLQKVLEEYEKAEKRHTERLRLMA